MTTDTPTEAHRAAASILEFRGLSGLELVAGMADGSPPRPSMAETLPFALLPPEEGKARLLTTLAPGEICPSHETTTKFVRPVTVDSGVMHIFGQVVSRGRTVITLEGRVEDAVGKLHAHGTSTCLIVSRKP